MLQSGLTLIREFEKLTEKRYKIYLLEILSFKGRVTNNSPEFSIIMLPHSGSFKDFVRRIFRFTRSLDKHRNLLNVVITKKTT